MSGVSTSIRRLTRCPTCGSLLQGSQGLADVHCGIGLAPGALWHRAPAGSWGVPRQPTVCSTGISQVAADRSHPHSRKCPKTGQYVDGAILRIRHLRAGCSPVPTPANGTVHRKATKAPAFRNMYVRLPVWQPDHSGHAATSSPESLRSISARSIHSWGAGGPWISGPACSAQKRRPRIILMMSPSVARVRPPPTPKLISQRGSTLRSTTP
jgi:hypothetical protein